MSAPNDDEFLITLPSNVPGKAAAGNRPTRYETRLARPLRLDGAWEAALMNFTYPHEWTCLLRDYRFTIAYPARGASLVGSPGGDLSQEQPIDYLEWHEHLSEADLRLPEKSLALRQLHFNEGTVNWNFSDEALFAADYPNHACILRRPRSHYQSRSRSRAQRSRRARNAHSVVPVTNQHYLAASKVCDARAH